MNLSLRREDAGGDRCTMNATDRDRPTTNLSPISLPVMSQLIS
ncbi:MULTISPECIES: hypothetical protein [unclassified Coleofasciculus]|nr:MULTISPECIES: hypothetical protein [unclassified Coleofasciculus]